MKNAKFLKKLTPKLIEEMRELRKEGHGINYLAVLFGVSETTIKWHLGSINPPYEIIGNYIIYKEDEKRFRVPLKQ